MSVQAPGKPGLHFEGDNPTADMILLRPSSNGPEVLLIMRGLHASACPGMPAFPGGFINAADDKARFHAATETPEDAARRELTEETGLLAGKDVELSYCGAWDAPWRDPRNSEDRRAKSHVFCAWVSEGYGPEPRGLDDAQPGKTTWVPLSELTGAVMAFDHGAMLSAACAKLGAVDPGARSWSLEKLWGKLEARRAEATTEPYRPSPPKGSR